MYACLIAPIQIFTEWSTGECGSSLLEATPAILLRKDDLSGDGSCVLDKIADARSQGLGQPVMSYVCLHRAMIRI
jgi:6-phosphogluconate dehydrogenase